MARFPRIQSPCPYKGDLADIMVGSMCQLCHRDVIDLTAMSDSERYALVSGCAEEICVSYRVSAKTVIAAAALGAGFGMSGLAHAQIAEPTEAVYAEDDAELIPIIVGGLRAPDQAVWVDTDKPEGMAELPVIEEADEQAQEVAVEPAETPLIETEAS
jgi:hypothetical protein